MALLLKNAQEGFGIVFLVWKLLKALFGGKPLISSVEDLAKSDFWICIYLHPALLIWVWHGMAQTNSPL